MKTLLTLATTLCAAATLPTLAAVPLPARELSGAELGALSGMPYLLPADLPFRTASAVKVSVPTKGADANSVQRQSGAAAAVYASLPAAASALLPAATTPLDFTQQGDLAQAWATMTASGVPHLALWGAGGFAADATASWHTQITIPGSTSREVVLRLVVPPTSVGGNTNQSGIARWRSRLRADVLVNGHPAWSTQSLRLTLDPQVVNHNLDETLVLQQFGSPLSYPTNDEDTPLSQGGPDNDSQTQTVDSPSTKKVVHLTLGRMNPGTVLDLAMILRGSTHTVPAIAGGTDHRCKPAGGAAPYDCSRGSVSILGGSGEPPRIYLLP